MSERLREILPRDLLRSSSEDLARLRRLRTTMADTIGGPEEAPRLWRVNRTIHELVKDRVSIFNYVPWTRSDACLGIPNCG